MVTLGISEFTFGFAFLYEQSHNNWPNLVAAPILPSLQQENELGWDARLPLNGTDFYYQFKLSDYLWRGNAKSIRDGTYAQPYFRVALHKNDTNRQHQRLREHSKAHPNTYYVAPEVNALNEFNNAYLSKQLTQSSRLIPIAQCRDIKDAQQHYITFREGDPAWIEHSTKTVHHQSFSGDELESIYRKSLEKSRAVRRDFFEEIYEGARKSAQEILRKEKTRPRTEIIPLLAVDTREQSDRQLLISASEVLSAVFGLTLVLVGEPR